MTTTSTHRAGPLSNLANQLTTARLFLSFVLFAAIANQLWIFALVVFAIAAITDWLDGYFARKQGTVSSLGRAYDPLVDKILVGGAFIFLMEVPESGWNAWMVTVVIAREFIVTGIRGFLEEQGVSFGADRWGKLKMVLQCAALIWIFTAMSGLVGSMNAPWLRIGRDVLNSLAVLATILSGLNYIRKGSPYLL